MAESFDAAWMLKAPASTLPEVRLNSALMLPFASLSALID